MLLLTLSRSDSREIKPSYAATFCGDAFIEAWGRVCEYKRLQHGRKRRSIEGKRFHALSSIAKKSINIIKFLVSKLENILSLDFHPSGSLLAQNQHWKHQNNMSNLFKVKNKDTVRFDVFVANLEQFSHIALLFTLLMLNG